MKDLIQAQQALIKALPEHYIELVFHWQAVPPKAGELVKLVQEIESSSPGRISFAQISEGSVKFYVAGQLVNRSNPTELRVRYSLSPAEFNPDIFEHIRGFGERLAAEVFRRYSTPVLDWHLSACAGGHITGPGGN